MVEVEIRGKKFPLCLTVAALDKLNAKCGGLGNIGAFLDGNEPGFMLHPEQAAQGEKGSTGKALCNTAWMLGLLIQEGEENRLVCARLDGEQAERRNVPDAEAIAHMLTVASAHKYRKSVFEAVNESMKQEIEAVYPKNGNNAEQV